MNYINNNLFAVNIAGDKTLRSYDDEKIEYAKGMLRGYRYQIHRRNEIADKLDDIAEQLSGTVHSPAFLTREEAKFKQGPPEYKNNICELITDEQELVLQFADANDYIKRVHNFLARLTVEELDMIITHFDLGYSFREMERTYYKSFMQLSNDTRKILKKF